MADRMMQIAEDQVRHDTKMIIERAFKRLASEGVDCERALTDAEYARLQELITEEGGALERERMAIQ